LIVVSSVLIGAAVAFGLSRVAKWPRPREVNVFTGGMPLPHAGERVGPEDFVHEAEVTFHPFYIATDPDPAYHAIWNALEKSARTIARPVTFIEQRCPLLATLIIGLVITAVLFM